MPGNLDIRGSLEQTDVRERLSKGWAVPSMQVLVTGATGAVGPALVAHLLDSGANVRVLTRHNGPPWPWESRISWHYGDVADPETVRSASRGCDVIFHLAALLHDTGFFTRAEYQRVNVDAAGVVARASATEGARLILFSSVAVYGSTNGSVVNETHVPRPDTPYAKSKRESEELALRENPATTILRLAAVYGPHMKGNYVRLVQALERRRFLPVGSGTNRRTLVHERDVAQAALLAAVSPEASGETFNVTDGTVHEVREIIAAISNALGRRPPAIRIPSTVAHAAGAAIDAVRSIRRPRTRLTDALRKYQEELAVDGSKLQRLGFRPEYDLVRGWRDAIQNGGWVGQPHSCVLHKEAVLRGALSSL